MTNKDKISDIDDFQNSNTYNTSDDSDDSKFTDLYTKTMDNVTMPQDDKDDLRAKLAEQAQTGRSGHRLAPSANMPPSPLPCAQFFCASRRQGPLSRLPSTTLSRHSTWQMAPR